MSKFKVLTVNDDRNFCECCGKTGLKKVVWIESAETGVIQHFGTSCAADPAKGFGADKEIKAAIRKFEDIARGCAIVATRQYRAAGGLYVAGKDAFSLAPADRAAWQRFFNALMAQSKVAA